MLWAESNTEGEGTGKGLLEKLVFGSRLKLTAGTCVHEESLRWTIAFEVECRHVPVAFWIYRSEAGLHQ